MIRLRPLAGVGSGWAPGAECDATLLQFQFRQLLEKQDLGGADDSSALVVIYSVRTSFQQPPAMSEATVGRHRRSPASLYRDQVTK